MAHVIMQVTDNFKRILIKGDVLARSRFAELFYYATVRIYSRVNIMIDDAGTYGISAILVPKRDQPLGGLCPNKLVMYASQSIITLLPYSRN